MSHHFVSVSTLPAGGEKLDLSKIGKWTALLRLGAIAGLVLSAVLFVAGGAIKIGSKDFVSGEAISYTVREAFSYSWLFAFYVFFTLALGGLFWTLLHNASNSSWGVVIRRLPETLAVQFVPLLFLGLPLLFPQVRETLWTWMHDHSVAAKSGEAASLKDALHHSNHLLYHKLNYLTLWWGAVPGFIPRFFIYFLLLSVGAYALRGWSVSQDTTGDVRPTLSARRFSCGWLPLFAISLTFAGFDWIKGLNYAWFSTMFGVNVFAGSAVASMALLIVITVTLFENGYFKRVLTAEHLHLMGKLMHAFTIFWAYIAFSQYFLIWYANIAEETQFYAIRNTGGWNYYSIFLVTIGHFFIPFILLLPRAAKKNFKRVRAIALWILFAHVCEAYWFIIPERGPKLADQPAIVWAVMLDAAAFVTIGCVVALTFLKSLAQHSLYPCGDPRLQESINVIN